MANCDTELTPIDFSEGYSYFPLNIGNTRTFSVTDVTINALGETDTILFEASEQITGGFLGLAGDSTYYLVRSKRNSEADIWVEDSVWTASVIGPNILVNQNNVQQVKLVVPVEEDKSWDLNAFNGLNEKLLFMSLNVDSISVDGIEETLLTVIHENFIDPARITKDRLKFEVFAKNIGLVYKYDLWFDYCSNCTEPGTILQGFVRIEKLISYEI